MPTTWSTWQILKPKNWLFRRAKKRRKKLLLTLCQNQVRRVVNHLKFLSIQIVTFLAHSPVLIKTESGETFGVRQPSPAPLVHSETAPETHTISPNGDAQPMPTNSKQQDRVFKIACIDNGLAFPFQHPSDIRSCKSEQLFRLNLMNTLFQNLTNFTFV